MVSFFLVAAAAVVVSGTLMSFAHMCDIQFYEMCQNLIKFFNSSFSTLHNHCHHLLCERGCG